MKINSNSLSAAALCALVTMPTIVAAQPAVPHRPAKAPPPAPLSKPAVVATVNHSVVSPLSAKKPVVVTTVAPKHPIVKGQRSIIFVGGKPNGTNAELNPQPIPPGHGGPGDPQHK
jgi:hypothetical protein